MTNETHAVPLDHPSPIDDLLEHGRTVLDLAVEWDFKTTDTVYRLRRFEYVPPAETAARMAATFGPDWTAGDVVNVWMAGKQEKAAS
jgi:hypothetical protein